MRTAIATANAGCSAPCKIAFQILAPVPPSGWFTITPSTPLPPITADRVFVDGATQTAFPGDTNAAGPEVALDGRLTNAGHGLELDSNCDAVVEGLSVGNFADHGIAVFGGPCSTRDTADARRIAHNDLGVDPTGFTAAPNLRGALANKVISILDNVISGNRYSGVWAWSGDATIDKNRIGTAADGKTPLPNGNGLRSVHQIDRRHAVPPDELRRRVRQCRRHRALRQRRPGRRRRAADLLPGCTQHQRRSVHREHSRRLAREVDQRHIVARPLPRLPPAGRAVDHAGVLRRRRYHHLGAEQCRASAVRTIHKRPELERRTITSCSGRSARFFSP
jgi:hypothetical protein